MPLSVQYFLALGDAAGEPEVDPQAAFDRLFASSDKGESAGGQAHRPGYNKACWITSWSDAGKRCKKIWARTDRRKLDEYF